ncbi:MAG: iron-containing alcohol dehydrogenase [Lachnospiraceae bacterium]
MANEFIMPGQIISGHNALNAAGTAFSQMGNKALLVTDQMMVQLGNCNLVEQKLAELGIACAVYSEINGEPTDTMIEAGLSCYHQEHCDFLIGLGGGSPIDAMKAIGALVEKGGSISSYMGKVIDTKIPPMAAIPTTAGTGSEATQFTIITDIRNDVKMLLKGKVLMPEVAVVDPQFTLTAPPQVTAATGLDALCHAVEAYTSRKSQNLSDTFALSAVKRIFESLPIAFHDGGNVEAREQMSLAALEAGVAFNNASVTIIHGMSRPIGALFHVPHGISNAMLMNTCLIFALEGAPKRFTALARAIGVASDDDSVEAAGRLFIQAVEDLTTELQIPTLAEYGIDKEQFMANIDKMAGDAMASGSPQNTIREVETEDVKRLYQKLW